MDPGEALLTCQACVVYFAARASATAEISSEASAWRASILSCYMACRKVYLREGDVIEFEGESGEFIRYMKDGTSAQLLLARGIQIIPAGQASKIRKRLFSGDRVEWIYADGLVPKGSTGIVISYNEKGRVRVAFEKGTWNFPPAEIRNLQDRGITEDALAAMCGLCADLLTRFLAAASVLMTRLSPAEVPVFSPGNNSGSASHRRRMFRAAVRLCLPAEDPELPDHPELVTSSGSGSSGGGSGGENDALGSRAVREFDAAVGRLKASAGAVALLSVDPDTVLKSANEKNSVVMSEADAVGLAAALQSVVIRLLELAGKASRADAHQVSRESSGVIDVRHLNDAVINDASGQLEQVLPFGLHAHAQSDDATSFSDAAAPPREGNNSEGANDIRSLQKSQRTATSALELATRLYGFGTPAKRSENIAPSNEATMTKHTEEDDVEEDHKDDEEDEDDVGPTEPGVATLRALEAEFESAKSAPSPTKDYVLLKDLKQRLSRQRQVGHSVNQSISQSVTY